MGTTTYQTRVPESLVSFCEEMGKLMSVVERNLYRDLQSGIELNKIKRDYQKIYGINARQFNSVYAVLKGKIRSRQECYKRQIKQLQSVVVDLDKTIKHWSKQVKKIPLACPLRPGWKTPRQLLRWKIHQKKRRLGTLLAKVEKLKTVQPSLIFGGRKLWNAQYNLEQNRYNSQKEWLKDWQEYRNSQFFFIGSKDETAGCQVCQLSQDSCLKIRVPTALESQFGKYVLGADIRFAYGQSDIDWSLTNNKAISYRFSRRDGKWYIFATVDCPEVPYQSYKSNGMIGVDLNPNVIGWTYCDSEGNLKARGQYRINLQDKTRKQTKAIIEDIGAQLVNIASRYKCPITIENLDFDRKKVSMREQGRRYSRMLSNFAYSLFNEKLGSRCDRFGIELIHVNPAYSSLIGLIKFMRIYGLSSDTAAALVIARRAMRLSERIPAKSALCLPVDRHKHVWSFWNALQKKLKGVRRHSFFNSSVTNSQLEVNLLGELQDRPRGKPNGTSNLG